MAYVRVNTKNNLYPGTTTIAELAQFSEILKADSAKLDIYTVQEAFDTEWKFEIEDWSYEYRHGYFAKFKDGSTIFVGADAANENQLYR